MPDQIPPAALEAAADVLGLDLTHYISANILSPDEDGPVTGYASDVRTTLTAALEAAAPHLQAPAYDRGYGTALVDSITDRKTRNPYWEQLNPEEAPDA